jgi:hypothetical protein
MTKKAAAIIGLVVVASLLTVVVAGCFGTTDYSDYYNKNVNIKKQWLNGTLEEAFHKSNSTQGNALYIGKIREGANPITSKYEHVSSETKAEQVYNETVERAVQDGFVEFSSNHGSDVTELWLGNRNDSGGGNRNDPGGIYLAYYKNTDVNSWVVETEYFYPVTTNVTMMS